MWRSDDCPMCYHGIVFVGDEETTVCSNCNAKVRVEVDYDYSGERWVDCSTLMVEIDGRWLLEEELCRGLR